MGGASTGIDLGGVAASAIVGSLVEHGASSLVVDPCGNAPHEGDFLSVMRGNAESLAKLQTK